MKITTTIGLLIATALVAQAAVVEFDLSPPDTDAAVGLSPSNAVPAVTNSMGSGDELLGNNLFLDMDSGLLMIGIGYGSAAGFEDLTGPAIGAHIHGPASTGQVAGVVADLQPIHFVQISNAALGGIIHGVVEIGTNQVQELLDGLWYVNIHTELNPDGEIRGQLIAVDIPPEVTNSAPVIDCPEDATEECGEITTTEIMVSDIDGDDLTLEWKVGGTVMDTVQIPGELALTGTNVTIEAEYPLGTNVLEFVVTDAVGNQSSCSTTVVVEDTVPPVITGAMASPSSLWPPNHEMVRVQVQAQLEEACGDAAWRIVKVTSNEPINDTGDGNTEPDWKILEDLQSVELRAERSGGLTGRIYTIWLEAGDESGNISESATVEVSVPHDRRRGLKGQRSRWGR